MITDPILLRRAVLGAVYNCLRRQARTVPEIHAQLGLRRRSIPGYVTELVALGMVQAGDKRHQSVIYRVSYGEEA